MCIIYYWYTVVLFLVCITIRLFELPDDVVFDFHEVCISFFYDFEQLTTTLNFPREWNIRYACWLEVGNILIKDQRIRVITLCN